MILLNGLTKLTVSDIFTNPDYLNVNSTAYTAGIRGQIRNGNAYIWDGHGNLPVMNQMVPGGRSV